ncbi:MAG TPA: Na+/H+ antiporter NhaA [Actinomycetota bacterium]|nr:Na+/H+ antiporter NhaA [Actinomycetota bacterium]
MPRRVVRPLQEFLQTSTASASLLFLAVVVALVWANSPWKSGYEALFSTEIAVRLGSLVDLEGDLHFWVNDGLMALFFLVVGLEIKREVVSGELRQVRVATLPIMAALGGMVAPALIYLAAAGGGEASRGWGIPMATDIAFALGVLALASSYASPRLKPLLLTLAIVDDIGAIVVIAIFYTGGVEATALIVAFTIVGLIAIANAVHIRFLLLYIALGAALWYATYEAGIHPTIAGVVLGLLVPAAPFQRPAAVSEQARRTADETSDQPEPVDGDAQWWMRLAWLSREAVSPLARTEHALLPWTSFVILPVFALANAGVELSFARIEAAFTAPVSIGIFLGLVLGKPLGVLAGSWITVRSGLGRLADDVGWGDLGGMGVTAGIGFTVALFIAELAFPSGPRLDEAKTAILAASLVAGVAGYLILRVAPSPGVVPGDTAQSDALQRDAAQ